MNLGQFLAFLNSQENCEFYANHKEFKLLIRSLEDENNLKLVFVSLSEEMQEMCHDSPLDMLKKFRKFIKYSYPYHYRLFIGKTLSYSGASFVTPQIKF